jgi:hypothetical protein
LSEECLLDNEIGERFGEDFIREVNQGMGVVHQRGDGAKSEDCFCKCCVS